MRLLTADEGNEPAVFGKDEGRCDDGTHTVTALECAMQLRTAPFRSYRRLYVEDMQKPRFRLCV